MTRIHRTVATPIREGLDTEKRWLGPDLGVIAAWERGRQLGRENPELSARARAGELMVLPWKGGVERALKSGQKYGTNRYLAMWLGLRGADLDVDLTNETELRCTVTGMTVIYTSDPTKYAGQDT
jgi:hypothetical protein